MKLFLLLFITITLVYSYKNIHINCKKDVCILIPKNLNNSHENINLIMIGGANIKKEQYIPLLNEIYHKLNSRLNERPYRFGHLGGVFAGWQAHRQRE